jgi:hypothetical protein
MVELFGSSGAWGGGGLMDSMIFCPLGYVRTGHNREDRL